MKPFTQNVRLFRAVSSIDGVVAEDNISEMFMGLILVPLVGEKSGFLHCPSDTKINPEKLAEHLTAVDEAWDNQVNFNVFEIINRGY